MEKDEQIKDGKIFPVFDKEIRCPYCNRLLAKHDLVGFIELPCTKGSCVVNKMRPRKFVKFQIYPREQVPRD